MSQILGGAMNGTGVIGAPSPLGKGGNKDKDQVSSAPPGSWKCIECGNVNYPQRTVCNGRSGQCGKPRELVDGGPPGPAAPSVSPYAAAPGIYAGMPGLTSPR